MFSCHYFSEGPENHRVGVELLSAKALFSVPPPSQFTGSHRFLDSKSHCKKEKANIWKPVCASHLM